MHLSLFYFLWNIFECVCRIREQRKTDGLSTIRQNDTQIVRMTHSVPQHYMRQPRPWTQNEVKVVKPKRTNQLANDTHAM